MNKYLTLNKYLYFCRWLHSQNRYGHLLLLFVVLNNNTHFDRLPSNRLTKHQLDHNTSFKTSIFRVIELEKDLAKLQKAKTDKANRQEYIQK